MVEYIIVDWKDSLLDLAEDHYVIRKVHMSNSFLRLYSSPEISDLGNIIAWDPVMHTSVRLERNEAALLIPKSVGELFTDLKILGTVKL